jgi:muramoyltetrapeptide carboxypeptidase
MPKNRRQFLKLTGAAALGSIIAKESFALSNSNSAEIIKPPRLKIGDTVAVTSPAGAVWDAAANEKFKNILEQLGFKVILGKTLTEKFGYFAGSDELRATELTNFFADKNISAISTAKGGWGCARILPLLNYNIIKQNPKPIIGFSDITTLLNAIYAKTNMVTYHGPVGNSGWNTFTTDNFKAVLFSDKPALLNTTGKEEDKHTAINSGKASGVLVGGNLSVICSLIGSNYLPDWKNKILFLEEVKEEPYRIDRMLTQLKLAGVLDAVSGIVFGKCVKCTAEEPEKAFTFMQVLEQHFKPLPIPVFYGSMIGHIENKLTIPIGINAEMDADKGTIQLKEGAVI